MISETKEATDLENVAVDLGYGFVKAISSSGKRVIFPSLVGQGYDRGITNILGDTPNDMSNMHSELNHAHYPILNVRGSIMFIHISY